MGGRNKSSLIATGARFQQTSETDIHRFLHDLKIDHTLLPLPAKPLRGIAAHNSDTPRLVSRGFMDESCSKAAIRPA